MPEYGATLLGQMQIINRRLMLDEERSLAESQLISIRSSGNTLFSSLVGLCFLILCIFAMLMAGGELVVKLILPSILKEYQAISIFITLTIGIAIGFRIFKDQKKVKKSFDYQCAKISADLRAGLIDIIRVKTGKVIEIENSQDVNPTYCYQVDGRSCLLTRGLDDVDLVDGVPIIPNSDFEIAKLPKSEVVIRIRYFGSKLKPLSLLHAGADSGSMPNFQLFECDWDQLANGKIKI